MAERGMDADLGLGLYTLPSFTTMLAGLGVGFVFGTGICSATSMTGDNAMLSSAAVLPLEVVGEIGVYPVFSPAVVGVRSDGPADVGSRVDSVTFRQLAPLEAVDVGRGSNGAGRIAGIWICGLTFLNFCLGISATTLTTASMLASITPPVGRSRSFRARVRSSRSRLKK